MQALTCGHYYHLYNRGINCEKIFIEEDNYKYFLQLMRKYIVPIADVFAYCLMSNHFHLLIRIKEKNEIVVTDLPNPVRFLKPDRISSAPDVSMRDLKTDRNANSLHPPHIYFSHLFNAYTKAYNKKYSRTGSLFQRPFKRIKIDTEKYLKHLVYYIHYNPVHHGFVDILDDYPWTSYRSILSTKPTVLKRNAVIEWFDNVENLVYFHQKKQKIDSIKLLVAEDV